MPRRPRASGHLFASILVLPALALAGCSGDGGNGEVVAADPAAESPLERYLAPFTEGARHTRESVERELRRTEELVAECMAKEGFEYQPIDQEGLGPAIGSEHETDWGDTASEEFVSQYGYGIADWPGAEHAENQAPPQFVNPNQEYLASLTESEQQAFMEALNGPVPSDEEFEAGDEFEYDWATAGCHGAAQHQVQTETDSVRAAYEDPEFKELFAAQEELYSGLWDETGRNEDITALDSEWATCMAGVGYSEFDSPLGAQNSLGAEYEQLVEASDPNGEGHGIDDSDLDAFREREIDVASSDSACKNEVGYAEKALRIRFALEQEFIDEHREKLDALLAKYAIEK